MHSTNSAETFNNSSPSPDRKRSLEAGSDEDEDLGSRGGRYKRQAAEPLKPGDAPAPVSVPSEDLNHSSGDHPTGTGSGSKAHHGPSGGSDAPAARYFSMRALVATKDAGIIIGKSGRNVAEIREESGAKVTVSENISGAPDRVITITGTLDSIAKAFSLIAKKIVQEYPDSTVDINQRPCTIRVLVPHTRMGSVIGKSGIKIKEIQDASSAKCTASEEILPNSSERTVTVHGVIDAIHIATYHIGAVLQEHPERSIGTILYKPQALFRGMQYPPMPPHGYYPTGAVGAAPFASPIAGNRPVMPAGMMAPSNPAAGLQMQQIFIPNEMVGAIIGKGGSKINEIRQVSGCQIKIAEGSQGATERLITITGSPEGNQTALYLLYNRLEAEKVRLGTNSAHSSQR
ncbi:uncharacterized protein BJ171DRAFT_234765 [Polychytrium aggregatum]|uniref:uncharacterized protein n=1 Tax=Polychytrium aggregatum TaxID=110093 RepID=UPI0022FE478E|nr:uncharacterized protein BJ171DRAFT_234765 [Polychytrium aggregatum]KAI9208119.1 hypothetical protein BJ171DRAFT_234765 [Polychytrium aggregatum]